MAKIRWHSLSEIAVTTNLNYFTFRCHLNCPLCHEIIYYFGELTLPRIQYTRYVYVGMYVYISLLWCVLMIIWLWYLTVIYSIFFQEILQVLYSKLTWLYGNRHQLNHAQLNNGEWFARLFTSCTLVERWRFEFCKNRSTEFLLD